MTNKAVSERACRKEVVALAESRGMGRDVGNLSTEQGKGYVQPRKTHFTLLSQSGASQLWKQCWGLHVEDLHSEDLQACGKAGLFLQAACLGMTCCEATALHNGVPGGCRSLCAFTSNSAPASRRCCMPLIMFDYFVIVVAAGMNGQTHPVSF